MNPFCLDCKVRMNTKKRLVDIGDRRYGMQNVWECPRCHRRYKKGCEVIRYKSEPKPKCFAVGYKKENKKCMECPYAGECNQLVNLQQQKRPRKKPQRLNRRMPIRTKKT